MESLHRQVLPFLLRRMKEDVLQDLPPKIIQDYQCELSPLQVQLYEDFAKSQAKRQVEKSLGEEEEEGEGGGGEGEGVEGMETEERGHGLATGHGGAHTHIFQVHPPSPLSLPPSSPIHPLVKSLKLLQLLYQLVDMHIAILFFQCQV